ncbi:MAG: flippase-like domain-containing protein [Planctomycetes bacterium]|nr:flippase-like domain-containing protein [Planctomycetota bacterium]
MSTASRAASSAPPPTGPSRPRWIALVKLLVGLAVCWLVVRVVPWRDQLRATHEGRSQTFVGTIQGEWRAERVRFVFDQPPDRALWPAEWTAVDGEPATVELARAPSTSWQPGMPRVFRDVDSRGLAIALGLAAFGVVATALRWWRLLLAAGCPSRFFPALRLSFIGFFFNIVVPGLTGGDLVKAVMIARSHPERRAAAAMSVLVDRLIGVLVLASMGAIAFLLQDDDFPYPRTPIYVGLVGAAVGIPAYLSTAVRRAIGFEKLVDRLPGSRLIRTLDQAITVYSRSPREFLFALVFSIVNQSCVMAALIVLGRSFGDTTLRMIDYVVVGAVGNLASAVPLTPGGVGVTEMLFGEMTAALGGTFSIGFAVSIAWRLCMITIGLCGGLFLLTPGGKLSAAERAELAGPKP